MKDEEYARNQPVLRCFGGIEDICSSTPSEGPFYNPENHGHIAQEFAGFDFRGLGSTRAQPATRASLMLFRLACRGRRPRRPHLCIFSILFEGAEAVGEGADCDRRGACAPQN